ncbi:MAG: ribosome assembly RNA-binding protein YhbY [Gammaproteobacteria bacterium]|jgi:RNA-binding protein
MIHNNQKKFLRSLAHHQNIIIWIGQKGITENVAIEIDTALTHHELVKIRIRTGDRELRNKLIEQICTDNNAILIQKTGNVATFFRRNHDEPKINLPK